MAQVNAVAATRVTQLGSRAAPVSEFQLPWDGIRDGTVMVVPPFKEALVAYFRQHSAMDVLGDFSQLSHHGSDESVWRFDLRFMFNLNGIGIFDHWICLRTTIDQGFRIMAAGMVKCGTGGEGDLVHAFECSSDSNEVGCCLLCMVQRGLYFFYRICDALYLECL